MLVTLLYASRLTPAAENSAHAILAAARRHNAPAGLTGFLLATPDHFLQVLEGPRPEVNRLYARIVTDPRHSDVEILHYAPLAQRRFARWAMGYTALNPRTVFRSGGFDPYAMAGEEALAFATAIAGEHSLAAVAV